MSLVDEMIELRWNSKNKTYYIGMGYEFTSMGDSFYVRSLDIKLSSSATIHARCDECGSVRPLPRKAYRDLCQACVKRTDEFRTAKSAWAVRRFENDDERRRASESAKKRYEDPEERAKAIQRFRDYWADPTNRANWCGTGNPSWNPALTVEDRERGRKYPEYYAWRRAVFERDGFTCQATGRSGKIQAHHIESYADNPHLRHDVDNGVTLHEDVHREFHRRYGKRRNTRQQFEEFIASFRLSQEPPKEVNDDIAI